MIHISKWVNNHKKVVKCHTEQYNLTQKNPKSPKNNKKTKNIHKKWWKNVNPQPSNPQKQ